MEGANTGVVQSPTADAEPAGSSAWAVRFPPGQPPHRLEGKGDFKTSAGEEKGAFTGKSTVLKKCVIYLNGDDARSWLTVQPMMPWRHRPARHGPYSKCVEEEWMSG